MNSNIMIKVTKTVVSHLWVSVPFSLYSALPQWYLILSAVCVSALCVHLQGLHALLLAVLGQAGIGRTAALGHHIIICEVNSEVGAGRGQPWRACR